MSGRFEGLTDAQRRLLEPLLPKEPIERPRGKGGGKLKEQYLGCKENLEESFLGEKEKSNTGRVF